jgi:ketosteroid isomerase-like protein
MKKLGLHILLTCLLVPLVWANEPGEALEQFHAAAALADIDAYFGLMTEDVVFLGTDGSERWQGDEFRGFVRPRFEAGKGWDYRPGKRHLLYSADGATVWFDEVLSHAELGQCRGSGVLVREPSGWKVAQYNLSVPIPNDILLSVVGQITAQGGDTASAVESPQEVVADEVSEPPVRCRKKRHKTNTAAGC